MTEPRNVVTIGELRLARLENDYQRRRDGCQHDQLEMDPVGETVTCLDCKVQVSSYWALEKLRQQWSVHGRRLKHDLEQARADAATNLHLRAAKHVESVWRSKGDLPACPHCRRGIMATDNFGSARVSKVFELGLRKREELENKPLTPVRPPEPVKAPKRKVQGKPLPKWETAPEWAQWLLQTAKGSLYWSEGEQYALSPQTLFAGTYPISDTLIKYPRPVAEGTAQ